MKNNLITFSLIQIILLLSLLLISKGASGQENVTDWRDLTPEVFQSKIENSWRSELSVSLAVVGGTDAQLHYIYEAANTATENIGSVWIYLGTPDIKADKLSVIVNSRYTKQRNISLANHEDFKSFQIKLFKDLRRDVADFSEVKTGRIVGYRYTAPEKDLTHINPDDVNQCDKLAGSIWDEQGVTKGLTDKEINIPAALTACKAAVKKYPANKRFRYQYARALYLNKDYINATIWAEKGTMGVRDPYLMSLNLLGKLKSGEDESTKDIEAACRLFATAASYGLVLGNFTAAYCHSGDFIRDDSMKMARQHYEYAAKKNFSGAQYALGLYFQFGIGGNVDKERAAYFFKLAEKNGIAKARIRADVLKQKGFSGDLYFELALLIPEIEKGNIESTNRLAEIYKLLPESHTNKQLASYWYNKGLSVSAKLGNPNALYELAKAKLPKNIYSKLSQQSLTHYKNSAAKDHGLANFDLGMFNYYGQYGFKENQDLGLRYFKKAALLGVNEANKELADLYFSGANNIPKNIDVAIEHYSKLTGSIKKESYFKLADAYSERGGKEDLKKAVELYHQYENSRGWFTSKAVQQKLYNIYKNGVGVKASPSLAKHYYQLVYANAIAQEKRQKEHDAMVKKRGYDFVRIEGLEIEFDKSYEAFRKYKKIIEYELMQDGYLEGLRAYALSDKRIKMESFRPREDIEIRCYSYRAKYNSEKTTKDCLFSKDEILVGFKFDRSRTGCESECNWGITQAREIIAAGFLKLSKKRTEKSIKYVFVNRNLKMKLHLSNNLLVTRTSKKGSQTLYKDNWFSQDADLCLYPRKLETLLSSLGSNGEYICH